jgi:lipopolysaccharide/colanic/teichoic acid biosynthesis glycosyltransferase
MSKNLGQPSNHQPFTKEPGMKVVKDGPLSFSFGEAEPALHIQAYPGLSSLLDLTSIKTSYINPPLVVPFNRIIKRIIDVTFSLLVIAGILSWLSPLLAIIIKLDSKGPVFFRQQRNKRNGELFTCLKFRSMIVNQEADIVPAGKHDKRITRVGKFLRDHYLDELPQFFNVLVGDMSLVGPRPHMVSDNLKYEKEVNFYYYRNKIKPGITGLAQVMGFTGPTENLQKMKDRVSMDIFYLRHWSFRLDMIIIIKTFGRAFGF